MGLVSSIISSNEIEIARVVHTVRDSMNKSDPDPVLLRQVRSKVIELLELYASEAKQREYQKNVPWVPVPTELVEMWFSDTYHPKEPSLRLVFSDVELEALARFHAHFDRITHGRGRIALGPDLEELLKEERWRKLMVEAAVVLRTVKSPDVATA